jgi:hypothetical protein
MTVDAGKRNLSRCQLLSHALSPASEELGEPGRLYREGDKHQDTASVTLRIVG